MHALRVVELYPSPWSERLRWVLDAKGVRYERTQYQPIADEEAHRRTTGLATAPVLFADGAIIGDSNAAVDWLEETLPAPPLVPSDARLRATVRAWEVAAAETMAPAARLVKIGQWKASNLQPIADHFATKYGWSPDVEARAGALLRRFVSDLARAVERSPYLVGDGFTRADLTVASMLATVVGVPGDDLFQLDASFRPLFGLPLGDEPAFAALRPWRDGIYRRHRGRRVQPAG
jgi:glutathione S-transferase